MVHCADVSKELLMIIVHNSLPVLCILITDSAKASNALK